MLFTFCPVGYFVDMLHRHFDTTFKLERSGNLDILVKGVNSHLHGSEDSREGGIIMVERNQLFTGLTGLLLAPKTGKETLQPLLRAGHAPVAVKLSPQPGAKAPRQREICEPFGLPDVQIRTRKERPDQEPQRQDDSQCACPTGNEPPIRKDIEQDNEQSRSGGSHEAEPSGIRVLISSDNHVHGRRHDCTKQQEREGGEDHHARS